MKLGRYEIVRELGKGAMGIVYLAKDPLIGRLVALKTIRPSAHADDEDTREFQQRFVREAQAAGILNHPSIVTVHDIGQDEPSGMSFIAMEYVEGANLKEVLAQGRPLSFEQAADIMAQVAEGLDFAHAKGIVHRDVKPANIILLEGNRAKITDFGIAKITSGVANLTTTGQFLGTPNYMAPEQIKGTPVDGRSDIFSLGICLYECLTHRKPFGGDSLTSISYKIVHEPFPPLHEINPTIPEGFADVVTHCLEKDPAKRFQRGKDMATALRAVIRGERPVRSSEPMFADATVVTRADHEKLPTMEIPFPEAEHGTTMESPPPLDTNPTPGNVRQAVPSSAVKPVKTPKPAKTPSAPIWKPLLTKRIEPIIFIAIPCILLVILGIAMLMMNSKKVKVPAVDTRAEARVAKERKLREEGNRLVHEGHDTDAYDRYDQLLKLAPRSPAITAIMQKLSQERQRDAAGRQQLADGEQKFKQQFELGLALYNQKKFAESIPFFDAAFHINPSSDDATKYLKLAQQEDERVKSERAAARAAKTSTQPRTQTAAPVASTTTRATAPHPGPPAIQAVSGTASITTIVNSTVSDGYIVVRAGSDEVARENLWGERRFFRTHIPRQIKVTKEFPAKNADLDFWVVIPSLGITERRTLRAQNFEPGVNRKLVISIDPKSKKVDYQFN
ncbi:MAG: eukaryotic-like serine/threonine-protein kinase [Thermoanaerobaculia bacterium]|nr:eukaryotic-like serine/threonine-protein kinase [Thermoanaerobaculia bacterium]